MADSVRKQVLDAAEAALAAITGIGKTSQNLKPWEELGPKDFPAAFLIDSGAEYERTAYPHTSEDDMECRLTVDVYGYVFSNTRSPASKRTALIADVETAMVGNAALAALVEEVRPVSVETDSGGMDKFSIFRYTFEVIYYYNHLTP